MAKKNEVAVSKADQEINEQLQNSYPTEPAYNRVILPRLSLVSQDETEGKGKAMKVTVEAGTFMKEVEATVAGKKEWAKEELGTEIEVIVLFERKQLKFYDGEKYTSSPVYDSDDQIIPLFRDKKKVDTGTPAELKARKQYEGKSSKGKPISKLEDNKVLFVLYDEEIYQMNFRGTSMYAFKSYKRTIPAPNMVLTKISSEPKENGATAWNQATFDAVRELDIKEKKTVLDFLKEIKHGVEEEKAFFARQGDQEADESEAEANRQFDALPSGQSTASKKKNDF